MSIIEQKAVLIEQIKTFLLFKIMHVFISVILLFMPVVIFSQSSGGGFAESYLLRDVGARPVSMAGAYTAIVNEPSALFYNPAGLGFFSEKPQITTMYTFLEYGRKHVALAWGQSVIENLGVGIGVNSYNAGSFIARDIKGNKLGDYDNWAIAIAGGASYSLEFASVGTSIKYLTNSLVGSGTYSTGYAVDVGMKFNVADLFSFGMAVNNISGMMFWNTETEDSEPLPFTVRAGIAMEYGLNEDSYSTRSSTTGEPVTVYVPATKYVLIGLDMIMIQHEQSPHFVLGAEAVLHEMIAFRGGLSLYGEKLGEPQILPMNVWGGGLSLRPELKDMPFNLHIDYAVGADRLSQNNISHHISLMFEF